MTDIVRRVVFALAAACLAFVLIRGVIAMPGFGHYRGPYGLILNQIAVPQRHVTDVVAAVNFDYRGIDTIGEEFILFVSVAGVALLLRTAREESEQKEPSDEQRRELPTMSSAVNAVCRALVAPTIILSLYIIAHGHLTPGGGFQGGAVLASAFLLIFLSGQYAALTSIVPAPLASAVDALGAGGFVLIGFIGLLAGGAFLRDALPLGPVGVIYSAGTIPLINLSVGFEVGAGFVLILLEFLHQALELRAQSGGEQAQQAEGAQP